MNSAKVLLVDDDAATLNALTGAMRLRMPNVALETCESGLAAVERIVQEEFDAVVTDIKMPGMDGLALLSEIRRLRPELPTLLITGHGQHDLAVQALRGGAFDFIQKPIERDYFVASLSRAISMRQMSRQLQQQKAALERHAVELERTVASRTRQLSEANQRKDEFLAMLSHELRNPLACVMSSVELLIRGNCEDETTKEICEIASRQAAQMSRLLDDLLDLSRVSRNKIELRKSRLRLDSLIEQAVASINSRMASREHRLHVEIDDVQGVYVMGDATRLEQVIVNLLNNAAKYTPPYGDIRLRARRGEFDVAIEVRDNGMGISSDLLASVFEPFVQADRSRHRTDGGLGIGLTLVRQLVKLHGGEVTADSDGEGRGSCFTVRLPVADVNSHLEGESLAVPSAAARRKILLVEDSANLARVTRLLLEECGQDVVAVVNNGLSAMEAALEHRPDIILLDIGLPGMDGYEVARKIREHPQLDHAMLVAMTGYGRREDRREADEAGFDEHLVKPFAVERLQLLLDKATGRQPSQPTSPS
ncbi:MAG: response regulator [Pirellulaceae bacterium]